MNKPVDVVCSTSFVGFDRSAYQKWEQGLKDASARLSKEIDEYHYSGPVEEPQVYTVLRNYRAKLQSEIDLIDRLLSVK